MDLLYDNGSILVSDVCELLNCSDQTIRRDLQELEEKGKLKRIHGGAFIPTAEDRGVPVQLRAKLIVKEKMHMARITAESLVREDDVIMLDSSTTCASLARHLISKGIHVTIISNSVSIACEFSSTQTNTGFICIGGRYAERSGSFDGPEAYNAFSGYIADKAFISCNALSREHGMLDNYDSQMEIRRAILSHSRERYLLVDHTKFDDKASFIIGDLSQINGIVTDEQPDDEWMEYFDRIGMKVIW